MNKNNLSNLKFLSVFKLKQKEKSLILLDENIKTLKHKIQLEKNLLEIETKNLDKLTIENKSIKKEHISFLKLLQGEENTFWIKNNNYNVNPFDNVLIVKKLSTFLIQTKSNETIYVFNNTLTNFLDYLLALNYSIIVLSVDTNRILLKLSLK
ncbi:hypothetical protein SAMN02745134_01234 [Clostridium acidisoli DSM 12555]|uniref:Uncharacterized protein n=1 Tax=Clostridium acidisoli DSM 12555 TaxID=1121291 RepID=A0A1W1XBP5_9CLOT|nr:hypothetical protein [Clostridium acidisoli]SMC21289.1 hypothetical protein SAMN02745134_01234 [Clostridium acidisoli DSM 12555]